MLSPGSRAEPEPQNALAALGRAVMVTPPVIETPLYLAGESRKCDGRASHRHGHPEGLEPSPVSTSRHGSGPQLTDHRASGAGRGAGRRRLAPYPVPRLPHRSREPRFQAGVTYLLSGGRLGTFPDLGHAAGQREMAGHCASAADQPAGGGRLTRDPCTSPACRRPTWPAPPRSQSSPARPSD